MLSIIIFIIFYNFVFGSVTDDFDKQRLSYIDSLSTKLINENEFTGVSILIGDNYQTIYNKNFGFGDTENKIFIDDKTIFRIYSMTKPITSVAFMILLERGLININDPISNYLPEFEEMKKVKVINLPFIKHLFHWTNKVNNPITAFHLLTHTSGMYYDFTSKYGSVYSKYNKNTYSYKSLLDLDGEHEKIKDISLKEYSEHMSNLPLLFEPGSDFNYGINTIILGRLIEVVSGKSLENFIKQEILIPLNMNNTSFNLRGEFTDIIDVYQKIDGQLQKHEGLSKYPINSFPMGGEGLLSTISDYNNFCKMLLNNGIFEGKRIISKNSIELMQTNHLKNLYGKNSINISNRLPITLIEDMYENAFHMDGFGLGFSINETLNHQTSIASSLRYGWMGAANTFFFIDPTDTFFVIIMAQSVLNTKILRQYENVIYQAKN